MRTVLVGQARDPSSFVIGELLGESSVVVDRGLALRVAFEPNGITVGRGDASEIARLVVRVGGGLLERVDAGDEPAACVVFAVGGGAFLAPRFGDLAPAVVPIAGDAA
ncbi:hypothetical protein SDC9_92035 [bioreactor metagenome]|uniref:Uncharacterized protein n=1 Tax=bioreactor metagenome TaxID=1076179 RepID=A0A644ZY44_9ZZZZ